MNYKALLESQEKPYRVFPKVTHYKNSITNERYFSNYLSYHVMPTIEELKKDLAYLTEEQKDYPSQFAFIFFAKNAPLPESIETYLADEAFDLENHLIFTNKITNLKLSPQKQEHIRIEALSDDLLPSYLAYKYEANLEYGESYAQQMLADNKANLMKSESRIYLAIDGDQIVGDITAWECGDFIEMDDFSVLSHYRGQGIGSALQRRASKDFEQIILITEEENRLMYQHQGYQEVAYYWTALQSNRKR